MSSKKRVIHPLELTPELAAKVKEAADLTGLPRAQLMRLALQIGIEDLRQVNFDLARVVSDAARGRRSTSYRDVPDVPSLKVADEPRQTSQKSGT